MQPASEPVASRTLTPAAPAARSSGLAHWLTDSGGPLGRLLDLGRQRRLAPLTVYVAPLGGAEATADDTRHLVRALRRRPGVRIRTLERPVAARDAGHDGRAVRAITTAARDWLKRSGGDLLLWGTVPAPGTTLHLRFVAASEPALPGVGVVDPAGILGLPIGFGDELAAMLYAVVLAAARPDDPAKARTRFYRVATAFRGLRATVQALPPTLTAFERASVRAAFGDVAAFLAGAPRYRALLQDAVAAYEAALPGLAAADVPLAAAVVARHRGLAGLAAAGAAADPRALEAAIEHLRRAIDGFAACGLADAHALACDRLGDALYRLEERLGDPSLLEDAVAAHRMALAGLTPSRTPDAWAEAQHNLARAAQVLGAETENPEWLAMAIAAGRAALTLRTRADHPLAWAAAQNTIGSALFLLARRPRDAAMLAEAAEALTGARDVFRECGAGALVAVVERNLTRVEELRRGDAAAPESGMHDAASHRRPRPRAT
jgi:hypothetical protein